nr:DUF6445 family protein [uncultured Sphingomonas sp.]
MNGAAFSFDLLPELSLSREEIGSEREPVLVVEGVLVDPHSLVDYAAGEVAFAPAWTASGGYPGVRAPAPLNYVNRLVRRLDPLLRQAFALGPVKLSRAECSLSLVTLPPSHLTPQQQAPHVDTVDPLQFAILHYLCGPEHGGTAFYRHRATGFETLTPERKQAYDQVRSEELRDGSAAADYIRGDDAHFIQHACFESRFDRVLVYRSRTLHSGQIGQSAALSDDPRRGRLTANIFVNYRPL